MISSIIKNNILTAYRSENMNIPSISSRYGLPEKSVEKIIFPNGKSSLLSKPSSIIVKKAEKILMPIPIKNKKEIQREAGRKAAITRRKNLELKGLKPVEPVELSDSERIMKLEEAVAQLQLSIKHLINIANGNL